MFPTAFSAATPTPENMATEQVEQVESVEQTEQAEQVDQVEQLRQEATQTAVDIIDGVQSNFVSNAQFNDYYIRMDARLSSLDNSNRNIFNLIESINNRLDKLDNLFYA